MDGVLLFLAAPLAEAPFLYPVFLAFDQPLDFEDFGFVAGFEASPTNVVHAVLPPRDHRDDAGVGIGLQDRSGNDSYLDSRRQRRGFRAEMVMNRIALRIRVDPRPDRFARIRKRALDKPIVVDLCAPHARRPARQQLGRAQKRQNGLRGTGDPYRADVGVPVIHDRPS